MGPPGQLTSRCSGPVRSGLDRPSCRLRLQRQSSGDRPVARGPLIGGSVRPLHGRRMGIPLHLAGREHWSLSGTPDSSEFFQQLVQAFPEATALFVEGSPDPDVEAFLRINAVEGSYLPEPQTAWSTAKVKRFRVAAAPSVLTGLADLARCHAEPELCDHVF